MKKEQSYTVELVRLVIALAFLGAVVLYSLTVTDGVSMTLVIACLVGGYMAMNIGANDVANNVGPAVGSKALTLGGALAIAAVFEAAGALLAGGEVVGTIRNGIINPDLIEDADTFVWIMLGALLSSAIWLNLATAVGAPVSTTHSIVGSVLGGGLAAVGPHIVDWATMGNIVASWAVSPVLGGIFAAVFLYLIKRSITYKHNMAESARVMVPILMGLMGWTFAAYLILKGLNRIWTVSFMAAVVYGAVIGVVVYWMVKQRILKRTASIENSKQSVNELFTVPLIFAAALLSFAHGSNDVSNAVGPLAAIIDVITSGGQVSSSAAIPTWVMVIGAVGISLGLVLFGPKVIRTVGTEITELDQMRAFCIAMSASFTVIVASQLGLPVSSTHIAVGGVFGVGFLREYLKSNYASMIDEIKAHHPESEAKDIDAYITRFEEATVQERGVMLRELKERSGQKDGRELFSKQDRKKMKKTHRQEMVKRSQIYRIAAAWVITVPASALMSAFLFFAIRGFMLP